MDLTDRFASLHKRFLIESYPSVYAAMERNGMLPAHLEETGRQWAGDVRSGEREAAQERGGSGDRSGAPGAPRTDPARRRGDGDPGPDHGAADLDQTQASAPPSPGFRITPAHQIGLGGERAKVEGNLTAIRILKEPQEAEREATEEEKAALVRYVGWGAFAQQLFDANRFSPLAAAWKAERDALADLVTAEEWAAARASTLTAYYTSEAVIRGVWSAVQHLGFEGGQALEPAAGVGHFIGLAPEGLSITWSAAELDPISGGIAQALRRRRHPRAGL